MQNTVVLQEAGGSSFRVKFFPTAVACSVALSLTIGPSGEFFSLLETEPLGVPLLEGGYRRLLFRVGAHVLVVVNDSTGPLGLETSVSYWLGGSVCSFW